MYSSFGIRSALVQLLWGTLCGASLAVVWTLPSVLANAVDREFGFSSVFFFATAGAVSGLLLGLLTATATFIAAKLASGRTALARWWFLPVVAAAAAGIAGLTVVRAILTVDTVLFSLVCAAGMFGLCALFQRPKYSKASSEQN
jgi:hypothetical protein